MTKNIEQVNDKVNKDRAEFNKQIEEFKKHPTRLISPKNQNKLVMCASLVAYLDNFIVWLHTQETIETESEGA